VFTLKRYVRDEVFVFRKVHVCVAKVRCSAKFV
jgi:hypothetical protein